MALVGTAKQNNPESAALYEWKTESIPVSLLYQ